MTRRRTFLLLVLALAGTASFAAMLVADGPSASGWRWSWPWESAAAGSGGTRLVITRGGRYSGQWASEDADQAAVTVRTTEPVELADCRVSGRGVLISAPVSGSQVTVRRCTAVGLDPLVAGRAPGRFVKAYRPKSLRLEHNRLSGTAGIYVNGDAVPGTQVVVRYNDAVEIDGRRSDGRGDRRADAELVQFVQFDKVRACVGCEIAWNRVVNTPGRSRVEDNISLYLSSGTRDSPLRVTDNLIDGAWAAEPISQPYAGGGIIVDGSKGDEAPVSAHVLVRGNTVIATSNHGIAVAGGREVSVEGNRLVSSGSLPDGRRVAGANVGVYVWDVYRGGPRREFGGHRVTDNDIGWTNAKGLRNDGWYPDCAASACDANRALDGPITHALERLEATRWEARARAAGVTIGPEPR
jgi:hypothetical protein